MIWQGPQHFALKWTSNGRFRRFASASAARKSCRQVAGPYSQAEMGDVIVKLVQRNRHQDFNDCIRSALFKLIFEWVVSEPNCRLPSRSDAKNRRWESKGSVAGATRDERTI